VDVPEAGDHANEREILCDHPRNGGKDRRGRATTEGFLPIDQHQGSQQRDGNRDRDNADHGGQVERRCRQERLHHVHTDEDQPAIDQAELPEPFLFSVWVLPEPF
jgi:hypothetical protein